MQFLSFEYMVLSGISFSLCKISKPVNNLSGSLYNNRGNHDSINHDFFYKLC